jgi:hypothetical protein
MFRNILAVAAVFVCALGLAVRPAAAACSAYANCAQGNCSISVSCSPCVCISGCVSGVPTCDCDCGDAGGPSGSPGSKMRSKDAQWERIVVAGSPDLDSFASALEKVTDWGVVVSGTASVDVGVWTSITLEGWLDVLGSASGFTASWDDDEGVISLTAD